MIQINNYGNSTNAQMIKLKSALDLANRAIASQAFKDKLMTAQMTCTTDSNQVVYDKIQNAKVGISVSFYTPSFWQRMKAKVSGWIVDAAECGNGNVSINASAFDSMTTANVSAMLAHESCHAPELNYTHPFNPCALRAMSVPYTVEGIVQTLVAGNLS